MEPRNGCQVRIVAFFCLSLLSQTYIAFGRVIDECPNEDLMIELQDMIENRYSMTCKNRCGQIVEIKDNPKKEKYPLNAYGTTSCSCDSLCYAYNDCCHNFEESCPDELEKFTRTWMTFPKGIVKAAVKGIGTCRNGCIQKPQTTNSCLTKSYKVISECVPAGKPCDKMDKHDPNKFIPIYDKKTHLHYTHLQCARCNGASNLRPWKYDIKCSNLDAEKHLVPDKIRNTLDENNCTIEVEPWDDLAGLRECFHKMENSCPDDCENRELVDKCEKGPSCFASAYINRSHVPHNEIDPDEFPIVANYKNYFCGLCNGVPPESIQCGNLYSRINATPISYGKENSMSLTTLFEFDVEVGVFYSRCPDYSLAINHVCVTIPSQGFITFVYTFKSVKETNELNRNQISVKQSNYSGTFDEVYKVFEEGNVSPIDTKITLDSQDDSPGDDLLQMIFRVTLNVQSSTTFQKCLERVEQKLRSIAHDILLGQSFSQFSVSLQFENDQNLLQMEVPGIPTLCEMTNQSKADSRQMRTKTEIINGVEMKCYYREDEESDQFSHLDIITYVCVCLSVVCLMMRVCLQCYVPHFRSGPGRMQFNLTLALLMAFLAWFVGSFITDHPQVCQMFAVIRYFAFMAAFAWMTNIAVDTWRLFRPHAQLISPDETTTPLSMYHLCGWLGTLILSCLVFMLDFLDVPSDFKPNFGQPYCWIVGKGLIIYFFIPTGLLLFTNVILFICTSLALRTSFEESSAVARKDKRNFQVYLKLFLLMGITWALGFVVAFTDAKILEYVYIFVNSLQGVLIFIAFVCTKRTVAHFIRKYRFYSMSSSKRSNTGSTPLSSKSQWSLHSRFLEIKFSWQAN